GCRATISSSTSSERRWSAGATAGPTGSGIRSRCWWSGSRRSRERSNFRRQAAPRSRENRNDLARPVTENHGHEEATVHRAHPRGAADSGRARRDHAVGRQLMLSLAVALPLAFLPIVSLVVTLRWMANSGR